MTVCIAAMCDGGTVIVGASDRMLTSGDVQFEPSQSKISALTRSIVVMVAGDSALQTEILYELREQIDALIDAAPQDWLNVRDVATWYGQYYDEARLRRAERNILAPFGLDRNTFISRQHEFAPTFINQIATELYNYSCPSISAIFAGVDTTGAHLYVVENGAVSCQDAVGFAAIGAGYWHADSQFMFAGHTRQVNFAQTLSLTYSAKKRAQVAPGVGEATDMFMVGPSLGSYILIGDHVLAKLDEMYNETRAKEQEIAKNAEERAIEYIAEISRAAPPQEQAIEEDTRGNTSANEESISDDTQEGTP